MKTLPLLIAVAVFGLTIPETSAMGSLAEVKKETLDHLEKFGNKVLLARTLEIIKTLDTKELNNVIVMSYAINMTPVDGAEKSVMMLDWLSPPSECEVYLCQVGGKKWKLKASKNPPMEGHKLGILCNQIEYLIDHPLCEKALRQNPESFYIKVQVVGKPLLDCVFIRRSNILGLPPRKSGGRLNPRRGN